MKKESLVILEDNPATADYLWRVLDTIFPEEKILILNTVSEGTEWLKTHLPKLALIDIGLPDDSGLKFLGEIKKKNQSVTAIIVTAFGDDESIFQALSMGADGYILKEEDQNSMLQTLLKIRTGEPPLSPGIALKMMNYFRRDLNQSDLSPRELETLRFISTGHTVVEASKKLGISHQTVAGYVKSIYQKLHVTSRAQATREAIKRGII